MVSSVALPRVQRPSLFWQLIRLLPGVGLLAAIGCAAKLMEEVMTAYVTMHHLTIPKVEYVLWAIVIGLVVSNTVTLPRVFEPGIASYELWLKLGIVLMGARFVVTDVMTLGGVSLALVIIEVTGSLAIMTLLGRVFGLRPKLISLLAMGSAVCGVSAIFCHCRRTCARRAGAPFLSADWARGAYERPELRALGRACGRQHR
jgi:uncharacterized membrane protein YadS